MLSKKMKRPAFALEIKSGRGKPAGGDESADDYNSLFGPEGADEGGADDESGDDGADPGAPGTDFGEDDSGDDDDGGEGDDGAAPQLTPHEMAHTSLADATYDQLMAAAKLKEPQEHGGDEDGGDPGQESDPSDIV